MWKIPLYRSDFGVQEKEILNETFDSGWYAMGAKTREFEKQFASFIGNECIAVSNGTAALHIALLCLNLNKDDEVILPALSFIAGLNLVELTGARPVLADAKSLSHWNVSLESVQKNISKKTKAIMVVHYAGMPVDPSIFEFARSQNIPVIEDAAHAIGASRNDIRCGAFGDMAAFSFFANKNIAVGEGGMFASSNPEYLEKARLFRSHGMSTSSQERHYGANPAYDITQPGLNYRIDDFSSALGIVQLGKLEKNNLARKKIFEQYVQGLENTEIIIPFVEEYENYSPSFHIFPVLLPESKNREDFLKAMQTRKIQTSIHYPSYKEFSYYQKTGLNDTPVANEISRRVVTLPLYPLMTKEETNEVIEAVRQSL